MMPATQTNSARISNEVYVGGKRIRLDPKKMIGKGGEADVFGLDRARALKVFKSPDHPDYAGRPDEQRAADERICQHQSKLRQFPGNLPEQVVVPLELATDGSGQYVAGYAMHRVHGAEPILRYGDSTFRRTAVPNAVVVDLFRELHRVVADLHAAGVTIGDFNDLNVLVTTDHRPHVIDADSFQFGKFACKVFTERFVDPLHCDPLASAPSLIRPYEPNADWYAFSVLLMQSLLFVGPYGGIYRPKDPAQRIAAAVRPLRRITVFHPDVQYPKPATPFRVLPDDLLHHFHHVFEKDERGIFPLQILEQCRFVTCCACGVEHARAACPICSPLAAAPSHNAVRLRGQVVCKNAFETRGIIVFACAMHGELRFVYHEDCQYRREDGSVVMGGNLDPRLRWRIVDATTLVGRGGELLELARTGVLERISVDSDGTGPAFDTDGTHQYWSQSGRLFRRATASSTNVAKLLGPEPVGEVLSGQTRIWAGPSFGLGLYRASNLTVAFVFDTEKRGINDSLSVPEFRGHLLEAHAVLDATRAWLFASLRDGGRTRHRCWVYSRQGALEGCADAEPGDGSWLGTIGGACATGGMLFAPTDSGICRVELQHGALSTARVFADTEPFVDGSSRLLIGKDGLYVVGLRKISLLQFR